MITGVSEALIVGCWSVKPLERNREGCGRAREKGWKNGGEAQLAAASNWAEQVSMADQTHMQRRSKEREGHKQSSRAGQAVRVEVEGCKAGRQVRAWSHSSSHSLCVTGGRKSQLSHTNTHSSVCTDNTGLVNTQKQKHNKKATYEIKQLL